jgi:hypothetical protein
MSARRADRRAGARQDGRVVADAASVERILRGSGPAGRAVHELSGDVLVVSGVAPGDVLTAWAELRDLVSVTGRRPAAIDLQGPPVGEPTAADLARLRAAAGIVDPWAVDPGHQQWLDSLRVPADEVTSIATSFSGLDVSAEARRALPLPTTPALLDRWVYDRVLGDPQLREMELAAVRAWTSTDSWFTPAEVGLVLLPTSQAWLAPAWLPYFGTAGQEHRLCAALHRWQQAWGAELVASWGTMLQMLAARRPPAGDPAYELAGQLLQMGRSLDVHQWQLALALTQGDAWFLHDRP